MKHTFGLIANILAPIAVVFIVLYVLPRAIIFFLPFVMGMIIAFFANPLIRLLDQRIHIMRRKHASITVILLLILLIGTVLYNIVAFLYHQFMNLFLHLPELIDTLSQNLQIIYQKNQAVLSHLPLGHTTPKLNFQEILDGLSKSLGSQITALSAPIAGFSLDAVQSLPTVLVYTVITFFSAYCFCKDGEYYLSFLYRHIPERLLHYGQLLKADLKTILYGWLLAQFKIMFVVFLTLVIGFFLLKVPYAVPLAIGIAFLDFLPLFGVGFILWPWMLMDFLNGNFTHMFWLLLLYLATQVIRQFMQPKIMGDTLGLSPFLTILFMYLGFRFYGFTGLIFAVPAGIFFIRFYHYGAFDKMMRSAKELYRNFVSFL